MEPIYRQPIVLVLVRFEQIVLGLVLPACIALVVPDRVLNRSLDMLPVRLGMAHYRMILQVRKAVDLEPIVLQGQQVVLESIALQGQLVVLHQYLQLENLSVSQCRSISSQLFTLTSRQPLTGCSRRSSD